MKKIITLTIVVLLFVFIFIVLLSKDTSQEKYQIGVLMTGENRLVKLEGIKDGLIKLGYDLDRFEFFVMDAEDNSSRLDDLAIKLLQKDVNLIVTLGGIETRTVERQMQQLEKFVPVVFVGIAASYELGLIEQYNEPGTYFTGVDNYHMNLSSKRLEMFKELIPSLEKVYVIYSGGVEISELSMQITRETAEFFNVQLVELDANRTGVLKQLEASVTEKDGIFILPSYQIEAMVEEISEIALRKKAPTMGIYDDDIKAGFLFSYGSTFYDQGYQASRHVSLILQGNNPNNLPVELPDAIRFLVNDNVRKQLDISIKSDILKLADVYEGNDDR